MTRRKDPPPEGRQPLPERIEPMKATTAELPAVDEAWGFEIKWDGVRAIALCRPRGATLQSRSLRDITAQYPEVAAIALELEGREAALDGELVAYDDDGRPSFQRLQRRMHVVSEAEVRKRRADVPVTYVIFDLLHLDDESLLDLPYEERRERLEGLGLDGESWQTPSYHRGDGAAMLEVSKARGLEGVVAKRLVSPYRPGRRGRDWLKVKNFRGQEIVIGGWLPGKGRREGEVGSLLAGYYEDGDAEVRRQGRHRLQRRRAADARRAAAPAAPGDQPLRGPPAPARCRLRRADSRRRGRLRRVDVRRDHAPSLLQGPQGRQARRGRRAGGAVGRFREPAPGSGDPSNRNEEGIWLRQHAT